MLEKIKERTNEELLKDLRRLKRNLKIAQDILEYEFDSVQVIQLEDYKEIKRTLNLIIQELKERGIEYPLSNKEKRVIEFNQNISKIKEIELNTISYLSGDLKISALFYNDQILLKKENPHFPIDYEEKRLDKREFIEGLKALELVNWKRRYDYSKEGIFVMDGQTWEFKIRYKDDTKTKIYRGDNRYPYNFSDLLKLLEEDSFDE